MRVPGSTTATNAAVVFVYSSVNDDSGSTRKLSADERVVAVEDSGVESSGLREDGDNVEMTSSTSTDDGTALSATSDLDVRRSGSSLGPAGTDVHPDRQRQQRDVHSPGHVTPPPSWTGGRSTSPEATKRRENFEFDVAPPSPSTRPELQSSSEHGGNEIHIGMVTFSSSSDDVFEATPDNSASNKHLVVDVTEKNVVAPACTADVETFRNSTTPSYVDVSGRLGNKNVKRHTLELDFSGRSSFVALAQRSLPKPLPVMRKSTSCCELGALATVLQVDSKDQKPATSMSQSSDATTSAQRPLLQLQLGQKVGVVCNKTESGASVAVVNVTSGPQSSSSTDVEDRPRDLNDNKKKRAELAQKEAAWLLARQTEPSGDDESGTIAEDIYFGVDADCITDDVIQRSSSHSSSCHERQLIFV